MTNSNNTITTCALAAHLADHGHTTCHTPEFIEIHSKPCMHLRLPAPSLGSRTSIVQSVHCIRSTLEYECTDGRRLKLVKANKVFFTIVTLESLKPGPSRYILEFLV